LNTLELSSSPAAEDCYPSRVEPRPRRLPRLDPVVHGRAPGPLAPDRIEQYARDGFLVLEGLLAPDEVHALNAELDRLAASPAVRGLEETVHEPDSGLVRSIFRVHALSGVFDRLVRDPRLLGAARQLLGGEVYVHQSRANLKPGFHGREFYWHSDFETWQ
jgi:ectoine hydroxylase